MNKLKETIKFYFRERNIKKHTNICCCFLQEFQDSSSNPSVGVLFEEFVEKNLAW